MIAPSVDAFLSASVCIDIMRNQCKRSIAARQPLKPVRRGDAEGTIGMSAIHAAYALTPEGWRADVRLTIEAGRFAAVEAGVAAQPDDGTSRRRSSGHGQCP